MNTTPAESIEKIPNILSINESSAHRPMNPPQRETEKFEQLNYIEKQPTQETKPTFLAVTVNPFSL